MGFTFGSRVLEGVCLPGRSPDLTRRRPPRRAEKARRPATRRVRGRPARGSRFAAWKSGPPARALTIASSPSAIRAAGGNRVSNPLSRTVVATAAATTRGTRPGPISRIVTRTRHSLFFGRQCGPVGVTRRYWFDPARMRAVVAAQPRWDHAAHRSRALRVAHGPDARRSAPPAGQARSDCEPRDRRQEENGLGGVRSGGGTDSPLPDGVAGYRRDGSRSCGWPQPPPSAGDPRRRGRFPRGEPRGPQRARLHVGVGIGAKRLPCRRGARSASHHSGDR
jgi:hypothetical protein